MRQLDLFRDIIVDNFAGNAVPPSFADALVLANLPELCYLKNIRKRDLQSKPLLFRTYVPAT